MTIIWNLNHQKMRRESWNSRSHRLFKLSTSSSVTWPPNTTFLIPSDGWNSTEYPQFKKIKTQKKKSNFFQFPTNPTKKNDWKPKGVYTVDDSHTWWERGAEEAGAGESDGGVSDQVSRSAVEVWGFLTGVLLSIFPKLVIAIPCEINQHWWTKSNKNCREKKNMERDRAWFWMSEVVVVVVVVRDEKNDLIF